MQESIRGIIPSIYFYRDRVDATNMVSQAEQASQGQNFNSKMAEPTTA